MRTGRSLTPSFAQESANYAGFLNACNRAFHDDHPLLFNHFSNLSVDQQLITSFFVSQARRAMATP